MLSKFDYVKPLSLTEALNYLEQNASTRILAGGTDLMVILRHNGDSPSHILDIKAINETKIFDYNSSGEFFIGASVPVNRVSESKTIILKYPALAQAANSLASYQLRNRATVIGNICNASPGADLAGPLMVYDAKVHIASIEGNKITDINSFFTGVKKTVLKRNEIVLGVSFPPISDGDNSIFLKQARIKGHDLAVASLTARLTSENKIKLAMAAVAKTPIRLSKLEEILNLQPLSSSSIDLALKEVSKNIEPISDVRASAKYRLHISTILMKRALQHLLIDGGK